jgi:hypothetical protein
MEDLLDFNMFFGHDHIYAMNVVVYTLFHVMHFVVYALFHRSLSLFSSFDPSSHGSLILGFEFDPFDYGSLYFSF